MDKKLNSCKTFVLSMFVLMTMTCSCGKKVDVIETKGIIVNDDVTSENTTAHTNEQSDLQETEVETVENLSDEKALLAIENYCCTNNPSLKEIVNAKEYPVYWEVTSSDENEIVVLFRSYTGALIRYYIDRTTGDTYITEYVPGITIEEQRTDESFNVREYFSED